MTTSPSRVPLTVVIPTLDEARVIGERVRELAWAAEVIVADGGSSDGTVEEARAAGARVLERAGDSIAAQRNAAIAAASHPWVLALDADERCTPELVAELPGVLAATTHAAYQVRRRNFYLGEEQVRGRWARDWVVRLFPKERRYVEQRVHERLEDVANVGELRGTLLHEPYRDLPHQLEKLVRYAEWGARDLHDKGRRASYGDLALRPVARFLRAWLGEGLILQGRRGLIAAMLGGCAAFFKYAVLFDLQSRRDRPPRP
ncbi:MAG TPA: glycosyltransferase family 2 protein [Gemmatimonadales bacterium]|nr:glycosyltransferase family 2 protein [Gemmatimonadales bacterium]